jgi:hypothetical protein
MLKTDHQTNLPAKYFSAVPHSVCGAPSSVIVSAERFRVLKVAGFPLFAKIVTFYVSLKKYLF